MSRVAIMFHGVTTLRPSAIPKLLGFQTRPARPRRCFMESRAHHCSPKGDWDMTGLLLGCDSNLPPERYSYEMLYEHAFSAKTRSTGVLLCRSTWVVRDMRTNRQAST